MFLARKPGQKQTLLAKGKKKCSWLKIQDKKQTLLAKKGKKCSWLKNQDKNKHCWQKREKCSWLGKSQNITDAGCL